MNTPELALHCELQERPARPALVIRLRAAVQALPKVLGEAYDDLLRYLGEIGEGPGGPPFVRYFNMDMQALDLEAGFPVPRPLPGEGYVEAGEIPAGPYATCRFTGPYSQLASAYGALNGWMAEHGYQPAGTCYEVYLNDPAEVMPEELETEILFPVRLANG
jgi:effector-binding domain-containing protein